MLFCYVLQDFGGGGMMIGWILRAEIHNSSTPGKFSFLVTVVAGGGLFLIGWLLEKMLRSRGLSQSPQPF